MKNDISRVLMSKEDIQAIVDRIGKQITEDYRDKDLLMVSILKGSVIFVADLMRAVEVNCAIDFMAVSSYGSGTKTSGVVRIIKDLDKPIDGKDILLVEDILDSGMTLSYIVDMLSARNPASIKICTLFDKPERRVMPIKADYIGARVPDEFIVGYGLDYAERYRNLPYIGVLKPEIYND